MSQAELEGIARLQERIRADARTLDARLGELKARIHAGVPVEHGQFRFNEVGMCVDGPRRWPLESLPGGASIVFDGDSHNRAPAEDYLGEEMQVQQLKLGNNVQVGLINKSD